MISNQEQHVFYSTARNCWVLAERHQRDPVTKVRVYRKVREAATLRELMIKGSVVSSLLTRIKQTAIGGAEVKQ